MSRRRRLLFMNYLPSRDLRRETSLTVRVDLVGGWRTGKKPESAGGGESTARQGRPENCMRRGNARR